MTKGDWVSSGYNDQGNHYRVMEYDSSAANSNSYHYSNTDSSYYYSNPNGSTYYSAPSGASVYTSPSGDMNYTPSSQSSGNAK